MGRYVGNKWHEELPSLSPDDQVKGNNVPVSGPTSIPKKSDGSDYDTNNQSDRADLRKQGFYIDNSGVYGPGSGQRLGDTWSGANGGFNSAPTGPFLPILKGVPISPWAARTPDRPALPGELSASDPAFASLFGPGSYFAQTGGRSAYGWMNNGGLSSPSSMSDFLKALQSYLVPSWSQNG